MRTGIPPLFALVQCLLLVDKSLSAETDQERRPHILMIVMDDLGSHDLGIHGTGILTPVSDQLALDGMYLENYYVLPWCSPTRAALFSGKYPLHTGVYEQIDAKSTSGLPLEDETLADLAQRSGYRAHAVGKWHLGHSMWAQTPTFRGFESFFGFYLGGGDYFDHTYGNGYDMRWDRSSRCGARCSLIVDERGNYSTHVFTREAVRVIHEHRRRADQPLFLYLAYQAVHTPNQIPKEYTDIYAKRNWTDLRKNYAGMLSAADQGIGNVTAALKEAGLWNDTLVIFTTDNGGPTTICAVQGSSNFPKRGGKCSVWEGGTTGDAFLSGPALSRYRIPPGQRFPHLVHVVDWLPTLAEVIGVAPAKPSELDGVSQLNSLRYNRPMREEVFIGYALANGWFGPALRYDRWKLVQGESAGPDQDSSNPKGATSPSPGGSPNNTYLLFDLVADPEEDINMADQYPEVVQDLMRRLQLFQQSYVPPQENNDHSCPFTGLVNTTMGPTWMPWCEGAIEIVLYS